MRNNNKQNKILCFGSSNVLQNIRNTIQNIQLQLIGKNMLSASNNQFEGDQFKDIIICWDCEFKQ